MDSVVNIVLMFAVALAGLAIVFAVIRWTDRLIWPEFSFEQALKENNVAVAIFLAALVLGLFLFMGRALAADVERYDEQFRKWGRYQFGYVCDWEHFKAQGITESGLDPAVCSHAGACGLMQLMPGTVVAMGLRDRFDARESIRAGIAYDRRLWEEFRAPRPVLDRLAFAFMSYNAGLGNVLAFQRRALAAGAEPNRFETIKPWVWDEPRRYVERIARWHGRFTRQPPWTGSEA